MKFHFQLNIGVYRPALTILFSLFSTLLFSQQVKGIVKDNQTLEPLPSAVITWNATRSGTVTDSLGQFVIGVPPGADKLVVSYIGYVSDTILYSAESFIEIRLKAFEEIGVVVIEGDRAATTITSLNPLNFQTLGKKELCKAACCNLSESFETNASIDAAFADAITGTKQIRMLGLDGRYTQMMFDNMPAVRGLASTYGLTYVPGPWVNNIYIAKGVGSVVGGYESITGQINVEYKSPDTGEKLHLNAYAGNSGRTELNVIWTPLMEKEEVSLADRSSIHLHPILLAHGAWSALRSDMNGDGFLDNPLFTNLILRNEWHLDTDGGFGSQFAVSYTNLNNTSGKQDYDPLDEVRSQLWGVNILTTRYDASLKSGYVFKDKQWKSFGSQLSASWHDQNGNYGFRQYDGQQLSLRANLLFASRIGSDAHKFTTGLSYNYDDYNERLFFNEFPPVDLSSLSLSRIEAVAGVFGEYTLNWKERFIAVAGIRADYHNTYGILFTPRLHTRYSFNDLTTLKVLAGKGYRTANLLMDNVGVLAGNREIMLQGNDQDGYNGMKMEEAWNSGIIFTRKFKLNHRDGVLSIDAYHTRFVNQVVVDIEEGSVVRFYNLDGESYSNSAQAEMQWSPVKRLEWRLAYRWLDVKTQYLSGVKEKPLVNKHRAFTNLAYATKAKQNGAHWRFDVTLQWIGTKRIPSAGEHGEHILPERTDAYYQLAAQVTYAFRKDLELYVGGENLTNFILHDPIISAEDPSSEYFDGSLVWGPVFGRMGYVGLRWTLQ